MWSKSSSCYTAPGGIHTRDAVHPKWIFARYGWVEGSTLERIIQLFFSYHYFFLFGIVWAATLNVVLQTAFVSIIPAITEAPAALHDASQAAALTASVGAAAVLCTSVAVLGVRVMSIIGDAMVVDGWWTRDDRHSTYLVRIVEHTTGTPLQRLSLAACASLLVISVAKLLLPFLGSMASADTAARILAFQACAVTGLVAANLPTALWFGGQLADVGERLFFYTWVWLRWSTFLVLMVIFFSTCAEGALWEALSNLVGTTILLIIPHIAFSVLSRTNQRLWSAATLFCGFARKKSTAHRASTATVVVGLAMAAAASRWFVASHGWPALVAVGYATMSTSGGFLRRVASLTRRESSGDLRSPMLRREVSSVLNELDRRRFVKGLIRGVGGLSVVILYGVVAAVLQQHHTDAPPLAIQRHDAAAGELVTEHLRVELGTLRGSQRWQAAMPPQATRVPAYCAFQEEGLSLLDFSWLSFLPYFSHGHPHYDAVLDVYRSGRVGSDWVQGVHSSNVAAIAQRGLASSRVTFVELYSPSRNASLVLVRGTDIKNTHDVLQDFNLFLEVGLFELLTFVVPGLSSLPDAVIADMIAATAMISTLVDPACVSYHHPLTTFVADLKKRRRSVVVVGHSLGGSLAQIAGVSNDVPVVAISSPGIALSSKKFGLDLTVAQRTVVNLAPDYDVASRVDKHAGGVFPIPCKARRPDRCHLLEFTIETLWSECPNIRRDFAWHSVELETPRNEWR